MRYGDFVRQWRLVGEHAAIDLRMNDCIMCSLCAREFDHAYSETTAPDCAAAVFSRGGSTFLEGYYGSTKADMLLFRFVRNAPKDRDPVCDYCIEGMQHRGDIEQVGEVGPEGALRGDVSPDVAEALSAP